jgi:hypothetical protein
MLDLFNLPTPQGCNIQTFYATGGENSWVKPRGVSFIYMLLIGGGGNGDGTSGGGSGSVTVWYGSANNVPDNLRILPGGSSLAISTKIGNITQTLISSRYGSGSTAGPAVAANQFAASGFYQSIAGQAGTTGVIAASATTFLSGGGGSGSTQASNYGYSSGPTGIDRNGFFQTQPIIVGAGGMGTAKGGIGCGSGNDGLGGPGFVLIASW